MTTTDRGTAAPALVLARSIVVGGIAMLLGTVAHATAGGLLPDAATMVALTAALVGCTIPVLAGPAGYLRLAALIGGGQLAVHVALTVTAGHTGTTDAAVRVLPTTPLSRHGGVRDALTITAPNAEATPAGGSSGLIEHLLADATGTAALMTATHFAAAAALAFWLWRGEQALWTLIALLVRRWLRVPEVAALLAPTYRSHLSRSYDEQPAPRRTAIRSISRRGPPVFGVA